MIRINLLPPEITEKRRSERRWVYIMFGALAIFAVLFIFFGIMWVAVTSRQADVNARNQEAQSLEQQASRFKVFEDRQSDLVTRQRISQAALAGRISWSSLLTEVSLLLPTDMWLESITADEKTFKATGRAIEHQGDTVDTGFKSLAKLLVRMSDLDSFQSVWLDTSNKTVLFNKTVISFGFEATVVQPGVTTTSTSVPAPPSRP